MRPTRNQTMLKIAQTIAERSTCARRKVGCVLTDEHGRILAIGHNGVPKDRAHCTEMQCAGASAPSGTALDLCQAIHAEQNALMFCSDVMKIDTCYVTASPCITCVKMLLNTSCRHIIFLEEYPHVEAKHMWCVGERTWGRIKL